jgi:hypothetical protein
LVNKKPVERRAAKPVERRAAKPVERRLEKPVERRLEKLAERRLEKLAERRHLSTENLAVKSKRIQEDIHQLSPQEFLVGKIKQGPR